uniref:Alginate_lyase2 n=1 Tax=uncultured Pseudomonas sp. TaxID=114707 RepID=A0A060BPB7_9PSED|nr:alginate_lyase2 [uncultured Pseudomonas sp.]
MLDISTWNLSVPTDPRPTEVTTQQIARGYQSHFFTRNSARMTFWVPVTGSHTSDSVFPRSELRETLPRRLPSTTGTTAPPTTNCAPP